MMKLLYFLAALLPLTQVSSQPAAFQLIFGNGNSQETGVGVEQDAEGNIYLLGNTRSDTTNGQDVLLVKTDLFGAVIWQKSYDNGNSEFAQDFVLRNGKLVIVGESSSFGAEFDKNAFVLQTDLDGNKLEFSTYGSPLKTEMFQSVAATSKGFVTCGFVTSEIGVGNDILVHHFGDLPLESWERVFGMPENDIAISIAQMPNGNIALCGDRQKDAGDYNAFVAVLDPRGILLYETQLESPYNGGSKNLTISHDGHILVVGEMATPTSAAFDIFLTKLTAEAQLLWTTYLPSSDASDAGFGICQVNEGSYLITGYSYNEAAANTDLVAISVDSLGAEVDRKYYGGPGLDIGYDVKPALGGGLLIAGRTSKPEHDDAILIYDHLNLATASQMVSPKAEQFDLFPTPVKSGGFIRFDPAWTGAAYALSTVFGSSAKSGTLEGGLHIGDLPPGMYLMEVEKAGKAGFARVVVQ
jgi:hypothetical protein